MRPVVLALTARGAQTAKRAACAVSGDVVVKRGLDVPGDTFERIGDAIRDAFSARRPVIGVCAAGILVRSVADLITNKSDDAPVVAVSEDGAHVVPLLGGHHGGNRLARAIAAALGGQAAVTTAGDSRFGVALDEPPAGWTLANPTDVRTAMSALLDGAIARIVGDLPWLADSGIATGENGTVLLESTVHARSGGPHHLVYYPRRLALGIGCERDTDPRELARLVEDTLAEAGLARAAITCVVSLDLKADEPAIHALANRLGVPARFFPASILDAEMPRLANPSAIVYREVGCHGVAEGAALAAVGADGALIVEKRKSRRATCAIAAASSEIEPVRVGKARGRLAIIGLGPGQDSWRTPEASQMIAESDVIVGYEYYLEQIAHLTRGKSSFGFPLGAEMERVHEALRLASEGRNVALVSSGDAGIYAMASLVYECLEAGDCPAGGRRADIVVVPGISALQAASARIGAPLGHDFCAISLSDLLTPWPVIENRIRAAALGDFVVAFYNPVSRRRRSQLASARDILLSQRPGRTPVVVARLVGRPDESVKVVDLEALDAEDVDMMTLVLVGSSQSRGFWLGGKQHVYTPRGYRVGEADKDSCSADRTAPA